MKTTIMADLVLWGSLMFAQVSDAVWLAIIGIVAMALKEYFDRARAALAAAEAKATALEVAHVKQGIVDASVVRVEAAKVQAQEMKAIATDIRKVELATNSMKDQLVLKTEAEGLARGRIEEREKADVIREKTEEKKEFKELVLGGKVEEVKVKVDAVKGVVDDIADTDKTKGQP